VHGLLLDTSINSPATVRLNILHIPGVVAFAGYTVNHGLCKRHKAMMLTHKECACSSCKAALPAVLVV
jgi:hypothetical protein